MSYYGGEGSARCTCDGSVKRRMTCAYHLFRDLNVARSQGVSFDEEFVRLRLDADRG